MGASISLVQTVMILMLSTGLLNHVIIIPVLLDAAMRDAWISVLLAGMLSLGWIAVLSTTLTKVRNLHLMAFLRKTYPLIGYSLTFVACAYLFTICTVTVRETVSWIHLSFSPNIPIFVLTSILTLVTAINAYLGIHSLANTAGILLPFVIILGFFVMLADTPHKDFSLLKPILDNGLKPVWNGTVYVGAGMVEIVFILLLQHHIRSHLSYLSLALMVFLLMGLTIGPLIGAIIEFGPEQAAKFRFPAYEEWRLVTIGRYIEHLDFFSIYQWFCGAFLRISLTLFLILDMLSLQKKWKKLIILILLYAGTVLAVITPMSDITFLNLLSKYLLPGSLWAMLSLSLIAAVLIKLAHARGKLKP